MNVQPFLFGSGWIVVRDGNDTGRAIFKRHYSRHFHGDGRKPRLYVGPGEKLVLRPPSHSRIGREPKPRPDLLTHPAPEPMRAGF
jgi:hypothetical protein